jgi:BatD DUF11 like domain
MRNIFVILLLAIAFLPAKSQVVFKTVVSRQTVVEGESFQVQYIFEEPEKFSNFFPPDFKGFRVVSGPNVYTGSVVIHKNVKQVKNLAYTLSALYPGRHIISGAEATINNQSIHSNDVVVEVISQEEAAKRFQKNELTGNSEYVLRPGEDPYEKIRKNLFLKVWVDRQSCYVGEPVEATFKLYSRLESKSDIVKNPGFYGFTVYDMVNLADKQVTTENVKGKLFDVHTIRKVQLYPLQEGGFIIDAMEVKNKVEFSRSIVNKKTEQEIVEGVLGNKEDEAGGENTETFETDINTTPVVINVKPLPVKNKPDSFAGATGTFTITGLISREPLSKNAEGILEIAIRGKGNFIQLNAPVIQWPAGMEGFEPEMKDSLDKTYTPLTGARIFRYPFASAYAGMYTIPPIVFSFFNPDSGGYKTVSTTALQVSINNEEKSHPTISTPVINKKNGGINNWLAGGLALLLCIGGLTWFLMARKRRTGKASIVEVKENNLSVEEILAPAYLYKQQDDPGFYQALQQSIWRFASHHFNLSGSERNKKALSARLQDNRVDEKLIAAIFGILQECEAGMFANAGTLNDKTALLEDVKKILEEINQFLLKKM